MTLDGLTVLGLWAVVIVVICVANHKLGYHDE